MASSKLTASLVLVMCLVSIDCLIARPFTGCKKKVSLLHRGDPADSETIEGDDCGNVKQIIGKWAKAKKVGGLAGSAQAAVMGAELAAKNTADAASQAKALGEKVGVKGEIPEGVKLAAAAAEKAGTASSAAATSLKTTTDTFSGKLGDFAKAITDDDIVKIKDETEAAITAAGDAKDAADRALKKASEAKEKAMKSSEGALKMIDSTLADTSKLSKDVADVAQKSKHAAESVGDLVKKSKAAAPKLDAEIKDAKEQAPIWEALKADLGGREKAAEDSQKAVTAAITELDTASKDMDAKAKTLQEVKEKAQSSPNELLDQSKNIDDAEASMRKTETALATLKGKVQTMMKDSKRLSDKLKETNKKLA